MSQDSNQAIPFQCHQCGECCSSWNIPIEAEKAQQLLGLSWVQQRLQVTRRELVPVSADLYRIPLTDENVCVFLAADRKCLIEVQEGPALKPHECKRFPFASMRLPGGEVHHEASAACKHISEVLLKAFKPIWPKNEEKDAENVLEDVPERLRIGPLGSIQWQDYLNLLPLWKAWLENDRMSAEAALFRILKSMSHSFVSGERAAMGQKLELPRGFENLILLFFIRKPYRTMSAWQFLRGKTYHDPRLFGEAVDLVAPQRIPNPDRNDHLIKAFLYQLLCRKRIVVEGGSLQSLGAMAWVALYLTRWYARALASLQGADQVGENDISTAIRLVERYYTGHQPRFFAWFRSPYRSWLLFQGIKTATFLVSLSGRFSKKIHMDAGISVPGYK